MLTSRPFLFYIFSPSTSQHLLPPVLLLQGVDGGPVGHLLHHPQHAAALVPLLRLHHLLVLHQQPFHSSSVFVTAILYSIWNVLLIERLLSHSLQDYHTHLSLSQCHCWNFGQHLHADLRTDLHADLCWCARFLRTDDRLTADTFGLQRWVNNMWHTPFSTFHNCPHCSHHKWKDKSAHVLHFRICFLIFITFSRFQVRSLWPINQQPFTLILSKFQTNGLLIRLFAK